MDREEEEQQPRTWQQTPGYRPVAPFQGDEQPAQPTAPAPQQTTQYNRDRDLTAKHHEAMRKYPDLNLSQNEYVVLEIRRHPIGLISIWSIIVLLIIAVFALLPLYSINLASIAHTLMIPESRLPSPAVLTLPLLLIIVLFGIGGYIATFVYENNRFYLTNESIIQLIQTSLFSRREQQINLANVEDVSYRQDGIIQHFFNYGTLRLSTQGEETIYRFPFVAHPRHVVQEIVEVSEEATGHAARFRTPNSPPIDLGRY